MRKHLISTIFSVIAPLAVLAASDDYLLTFSTPGPDRYVDGTIVPDGECYALVWSPAGKTFSGFNADGTAASALDRVVLAGPLALSGRCRDSIFQVPKAEYDALEGGTWAVCLVDTRKANGVPAGVKDGKPLRVNRWGIVNSGVRIEPASASKLALASPAGGTRPRASSGTGVRASKLSQVPSYTTAPTITAMTLSDGIVTLYVTDTDPYLSYTIESGPRLGIFAIDGAADVVDGETGEEIEIGTGAHGATRFFRVIRAE
jgi:hypothetical protein